MEISWYKDQTSSKVIVQLEIDEAEFAAARLNGLSGSSKISDRLLWFAKMAEEQEGCESIIPFDLEQLYKSVFALGLHGVSSMHGLNEQRKLYGLPALEEV